MENARGDLAVLAQAEAAMSAPQGKAQVRRLWNTGSSMVAYLEREPGKKLPQARQFFLYYLDTAAHLLERYQDFQRAGCARRRCGTS